MKRIYLALGDSMSIDLHTGVLHGGAVAQFHRWLGPEWERVDHCRDGCGIASVPRARALPEVVGVAIPASASSASTA